MASTFEVMFLGFPEPDAADQVARIDGTGRTDLLIGQTFGGRHAPLFRRVQILSTPWDAHAFCNASTNKRVGFRVDDTTMVLARVTAYIAHLTYMDGTSEPALAHIAQATDSTLFLVPNSHHADLRRAILDAKPITSIRILRPANCPADPPDAVASSGRAHSSHSPSHATTPATVHHAAASTARAPAPCAAVAGHVHTIHRPDRDTPPAPVQNDPPNCAPGSSVCFVKGTQIRTINGDVNVEDLKVNDLVMTTDAGPQPVRWIGKRILDATALANNPELRPIRISKTAIGLGNISHDLYVSQQHRMLMNSSVARRMFGRKEVLIAAIDLTEMDGFCIATDIDNVTYFHILLDDHHLLFANGIPAESLHLEAGTLRSLSPAGYHEIKTLFPEITTPDFHIKSCRRVVTGKRARQLAARHAKNGKPLHDIGVILPSL